jgi:hypothetical protein
LRLANCATPLFATFLSFCWLRGGDVLLSARQLKRKRRKKKTFYYGTHTPAEWSALSLGLLLLETHFDAALVLKRRE